MQKFILKINILTDVEFGLDIDIIYWDKRFLWISGLYSNKDEVYLDDYYGNDNFMIFSYDKGYILENQFVIPERSVYTPNYKLSYTFDTDGDRHDFLKRLYVCLNDWGQYWNEMLRDKERIYNEKIMVNGKFWAM